MFKTKHVHLGFDQNYRAKYIGTYYNLVPQAGYRYQLKLNTAFYIPKIDDYYYDGSFYKRFLNKDIYNIARSINNKVFYEESEEEIKATSGEIEMLESLGIYDLISLSDFINKLRELKEQVVAIKSKQYRELKEAQLKLKYMETLIKNKDAIARSAIRQQEILASNEELDKVLPSVMEDVRKLKIINK